MVRTPVLHEATLCARYPPLGDLALESSDVRGRPEAVIHRRDGEDRFAQKAAIPRGSSDGWKRPFAAL
jgi:hypothetical protein